MEQNASREDDYIKYLFSPRCVFRSSGYAANRRQLEIKEEKTGRRGEVNYLKMEGGGKYLCYKRRKKKKKS